MFGDKTYIRRRQWGLFSTPSICEWCGAPLWDGSHFLDLTLGNAFTQYFNQKRHYGYFCSPKCRLEAVGKGSTGLKHSMFLPRFEKALREWLIYQGMPKQQANSMTDEELMREMRTQMRDR